MVMTAMGHAPKTLLAERSGLFDYYPGRGEQLVREAFADDLKESQEYRGRWRKGGNSRHDYARYLREKTGQGSCAYCKMNLVDTYDHWLMTSVDHVVPWNANQHEKIKAAWIDDLANAVLCCSACNGFLSQVTLKRLGVLDEERHPRTVNEFFALRNKVFSLKREKALERHKEERAFFSKTIGGKPG